MTSPAKPTRCELMRALEESDRKTVKALLEQGADPNEPDKEGNTPLHNMVCRQPFDEITALLIEHGAKVDAQTLMGFTPLMKAVFRSNIPAIRFLIKHGATLDIKDHPGHSAIDYASRTGSPAVVDILKEALAQQASPKKTIAQELIEAIWAKDIDRLKDLLEQGADPDTRDESYLNNTPLYHSLAFNNIEMAKLFLAYKADPNLDVAHGFTALMEAARNGTLAFAELLLDHGADPDLKNTHGSTTFMIAAKHNPAVARLLMERGADLTINDNIEVCDEVRQMLEQKRIADFHETAAKTQAALKARSVRFKLNSGPRQ